MDGEGSIQRHALTISGHLNANATRRKMGIISKYELQALCGNNQKYWRLAHAQLQSSEFRDLLVPVLLG